MRLKQNNIISAGKEAREVNRPVRPARLAPECNEGRVAGDADNSAHGPLRIGGRF
jgi:hypothetical protein